MKFVPIRINSLIGIGPLEFDIFIKLPHKYLRYAKPGVELEDYLLSRLKSKKVRKLFINEADEIKFQGVMDSNLEKKLGDPGASLESKTQAVVGVGSHAADKVAGDPKSEASYQAAQKASQYLVRFLEKESEALTSLMGRDAESGADKTQILRDHCLNVSSLAVKFGISLGMSQVELELLGVAGFYHDIGFSELGPEAQELFFRPLEGASPGAITEYKSHPTKGAELLQDRAFVAPEVFDLIKTHEERANGSGFPGKISKWSRLQEVHALCCHFDRQATCLGKPRKEVAQSLVQQEVGNFSLDILKRFKAFALSL